MSRVITTALDELGVSEDDFYSNGRAPEVVAAREIVAVLGRELTDMSYPELAAAMGRPNHSTAVDMCRRGRERRSFVRSAEIEMCRRALAKGIK